ncbi:putative short-chain dehydrogenase [Canariomyces notabilis]|uniref:Short-chain dehydrogenase n=1 Tax=Canariomyces notabilis TaxID=2074819 RepID=A0AAN6TE66_9PEZI|nr:putative short-chain dehydrogenase [Canariomyces arenarius]
MSNLANLRGYLHSQLRVKLPVPTKKFTDQVVIVTGSNVGMGLEAARHIARLGAAKVILAVRSIQKGEAAAKSIVASTKRDPSVVEVWELDLARYQSVEAFAQRAQLLPRIDVLVANAGIFMMEFTKAEDNETNITVNVISHMLLALLLLPKLRETAVMTGKPGVVTFTGSFTHWMTQFPERNSSHILDDLADEGKSKGRMRERYYVSKLIQLLVAREFAKELSNSSKPGKVITNVVNPGFVATQIMRHGGPVFQVYLKLMKAALSRTAEEGGRTVVNGAEGGEETHGQYLNDCQVGSPSTFVLSEEGGKVQKQLWDELMAKLEKVHPGVTQNI